MTAASVHRVYQRFRNKGFSLLLSGSFAGFGASSVLVPPLRMSGEAHIRIGRGVFIGGGTWLQVLGSPPGVALSIGDDVSCAGGAVLSAVRSVVIEPAVLIARGVYIADHGHAFEDAPVPVLAQGVRDVRPVRVCAGAWLGQNAVVLPGVTIGPGAVVGAGAVVREDVAARTLVVGAPARPVRSWTARATPPDVM